MLKLYLDVRRDFKDGRSVDKRRLCKQRAKRERFHAELEHHNIRTTTGRKNEEATCQSRDCLSPTMKAASHHLNFEFDISMDAKVTRCALERGNIRI